MIFDFRKILSPLIAIMLVLFAVISWKFANDIVKPVWCMMVVCEPDGWKEQEKRKELEEILIDNGKTHQEEIANKEDNHLAVIEKMEYDTGVENMVDKITKATQSSKSEVTITPEVKLDSFKPKVKPEATLQTEKPKVQEPDLVAEKMANDLWTLYLF